MSASTVCFPPRPLRALGIVLLLVLATPVVAETPQGLEIHVAEPDQLVATYASPHAAFRLDGIVIEDQIIFLVARDDGTTLARFGVPVLEGADIAAAYRDMTDAVVDELVADASFAEALAEVSFQDVWTAVQMIEEIALRLSDGAVMESILVAARIVPNALGHGKERIDAEESAEAAPLAKAIAWYSGDNDCFGACGPGCDWCVNKWGGHVCVTTQFCRTHDAYCGAWEDFFNCDFFDCGP